MAQEMQNPFYVHPGTDFGPGLKGLSNTIARVGAMKKAERKDTLMRQEISAAMAYQDPEKIRTIAGKYPEMGTKIKDIVEMKFPGGAGDKYKKALLGAIMDPGQSSAALEEMKTQMAFDGLDDNEKAKLDGLEKMIQEDPEKAKKVMKSELALISDKDEWSKYSDLFDKIPAKVSEFKYFKDLKETDPDLADQFALGAGFKQGEGAAETNFNKYIGLLSTNPEQAKLFGDQIGINRNTPLTDIAKLKADLSNGNISQEDYNKQRNKILNPAMKTKTELAAAALKGDPEAIAIIKKMTDDAIEETKGKSYATTQGKLKGLFESMDGEGAAQAIIAGRETLNNVRNTFGVPIQEMVRKRVLELEPEFNFVQPRAIEKSLASSLVQQQKNRGSMGSFVQNISGQLDKVDQIMTDVIKRTGVRYIDLPWREVHTKALGSGHEKVLEAYMKEISVEIFKLSQGSTASVALLPEAGRQEWEAIHDVNLSYKELKKVLVGTRDMANIRLKSVNDEIKATVGNLSNIRSSENMYMGSSDGPGAEFPNTVTVTNPETGEEEVWDTTTEKRVK